MTGGLASVSIMRPSHCGTVLHMSILAVLLLTLNVGSDECSFSINVRRNTVYEASVGQDLRINCSVTFCNSSPPTVSWYKIVETLVPVNVSSRIKTEFRLLKQQEGMSSLIFRNILRSDSGRYRCQGGDSVSHSINVSVYGDVEVTTVTQNDTNSTSSAPELVGNVWMYVYSAAGIGSFVTIVIIISVISMRGCKRKPKKEAQTENQYIAIPMAEQPFPQARSSPRGSPSVPPPQRPSQRKTPPRPHNELILSRDKEQARGQLTEDRERQGNTLEGEGSSVVYAALNHQLPPRAAARPRRLVEEKSEYAAIRVG